MGIYLGTDLETDRTVSADVCIVGTGAGGAVLGARLARAGKKVVFLEDGGFHTSDRFDMTERNMFPRLYQELGGRATADQSMLIAQGRAVGGSTVVNWTTCFRTPKHVMERWHEHHGVTGLTHEALEPHFATIEEELGVVKMRLEQVNRNNRVTWDGLGKLGWHRELISRNVRGCAHTGYCGMGCPIDAKQSMLVTMIPAAVRAGADVYANAWVERVTRDGRRCTTVIARLRDPASDRKTGKTLTVSARVTVLSGGAINTPAILLRSEVNPNGRTGMRTFLHPAVPIVGFHPEAIEPFVGAPQYVYSDQFVDRGPHMSFLVEGAPMFPMGTGAFTNAPGDERQALLRLLPHSSLTGVLLHDGFDVDNPDEGARVSLKPNGNPRIDYEWNRRLREGLRSAVRAGMEIQLAGGARQVVTATGRYVTSRDEVERALPEADFEPGKTLVLVAHCMGGCPIGTDPKKSVVDSTTLRHHDFDNLFVVDGSVYPTSLTVNPQISIYGLASWAAQHVGAAVG